MICVRCGKFSAQIDNLCRECFKETHIKIEAPSKYEIKRCPHCSSLKVHGEWISEEARLIETLGRKVKVTYPVDKVIMKGYLSTEGELVFFNVEIEYSVRDVWLKDYIKIPIKFHSECCTVCSRIYGNYFEAIVQIRGAKSEAEEEMIKRRFYEIMESIKDRKLFVNREEKVRGGVDIYVSDKHHAKQIVSRLSEEFGATVRESPQLAGRRDGREIYRVTYSIRLPPYRRGDVIKIDEKFFVIRDITNKGFSAMDIDAGKLYLFKHREFEEKGGMVVCRQKDIARSQVICFFEDVVQILHPKTYEVMEVKKPSWYPKYDIGIVLLDEDSIIVPIIE